MRSVARLALRVARLLRPPLHADQGKHPSVARSGGLLDDPETPEKALATAVAAATATSVSLNWKGWLFLAGLVLAGLGWYVFQCRFYPFASCKKCEGSGKKRSYNKKNWRKCRRCKGSGTRIRTGRRVFEYLNVTAEEAGK